MKAVKPESWPWLHVSGFHFRESCSNAIVSNAIVIFSKTCAKPVVPANITESQMRCRVTLAVVAAFVGGSSIAAHAQAPAAGNPGGAVAGNRGGAVAGTGGTGARAAGQSAKTGGTISGVGTGGILGTTRAGTGGVQDNATFGSSTGGIKE